MFDLFDSSLITVVYYAVHVRDVESIVQSNAYWPYSAHKRDSVAGFTAWYTLTNACRLHSCRADVTLASRRPYSMSNHTNIVLRIVDVATDHHQTCPSPWRLNNAFKGTGPDPGDGRVQPLGSLDVLRAYSTGIVVHEGRA
jgi:hypothetical protein